jgi:hypothetical protein
MLWAQADEFSAPIQRIQIIKGWMQADDRLMEKTFDVACAGGARPDPRTQRCAQVSAPVSLQTCRPDRGKGAEELATTWRDPEFRDDHPAFYYVRVLENPSCRWSTVEALRLGRPLSPLVPKTVQQRAWSSPIWYYPALRRRD